MDSFLSISLKITSFNKKKHVDILGVLLVQSLIFINSMLRIEISNLKIYFWIGKEAWK